MEDNNQYTNEKLAKKFENNFDLVNYAISLAENMIQSGRDPRVRKPDMQNRAMLILEEIREGKDQFDEIFTEGVSPVERAAEEMGGEAIREHRHEKRRQHVPLDLDEES